MNEQEKYFQECEGEKMPLTPWIVQTVVYELIANHLINNDPAKMGYTFKQRYDPDKQRSDINLDISYNWQKDTTSKRPAIYVNRGDAKITSPTIGQGIGGSKIKDSERNQISLIELPITVSVVASPVGFVEQLADYLKYPFMYFAQQIQKDFCFQKFRLSEISKPNLTVEQKDEFVIELNIEVNYSDRWIVKGDFLKLKTANYQLFNKDNV